MAAVFFLVITIITFPISSTSTTTTAIQTNNDIKNLLLIKSGFADPSSLSSWNQTTSPCNTTNANATMAAWVGILCTNGAITSIILENLSLSGYIDVPALSKLKSLRALSFARNSFRGPIPMLGRLDGLKALYLSNNAFSGAIPGAFFDRMDHLKKLHLDDNRFAGPIPSSLSKCIALKELDLRGNLFSGPIPPGLNLPNLTFLNVSQNGLTGPVPEVLAGRFEEDSFRANPELCGPPLVGKPCPVPEPPRPAAPGPGRSNAGLIGGAAIVAAALMIVLLMLLTLKRKRDRSSFDRLGDDGSPKSVASSFAKAASAKSVGSSTKSSRRKEKARPEEDLAMLNEAKGAFNMSDLMKAAAEAVGSGGMGSVYKAVMDNGTVLAVKRVREMNRVGKDAFDVEMRRLGRLKHDHVLPPLAYHYRKEEKLIVSEFLPKGSLLYILHGDRGVDHASLNWQTRLKILVGIARGMCYLHAELNYQDIPHGNLKSSNVLLTSTYEPLLMDYGFLSLINPSVASQSMFAYKSPESFTQRRLCPKSDVYCFGVIILEVLIGKFPSQYLNNTKGGTDVIQWVHSAVSEDVVAELIDPAIIIDAKEAVPEMERVIHVGVACVESDPDVRIDMKEACRRLEEIAANVNKSTVVTLTRKGSYAEGLLLREGSARRSSSIVDRSSSLKDHDSFSMS